MGGFCLELLSVSGCLLELQSVSGFLLELLSLGGFDELAEVRLAYQLLVFAHQVALEVVGAGESHGAVGALVLGSDLQLLVDGLHVCSHVLHEDKAQRALQQEMKQPRLDLLHVLVSEALGVIFWHYLSSLTLSADSL